MEIEACKKEILALEEKRYQAMLNEDFAVLNTLLADTLVYTHSSAEVDTKASYLDGLRTKKFVYKTAERPVENVQIYGDTAIVSGELRMDILSRGTPRVVHSRYIDVWFKGTNGWQMVGWQSTPILA